MNRDEIATLVFRAYDVPPWVAGSSAKPRFPRLRWALRRVWPIKAKARGMPDGWGTAIERYEAEALSAIQSGREAQPPRSG
jgi:hypothetical protein